MKFSLKVERYSLVYSSCFVNFAIFASFLQDTVDEQCSKPGQEMRQDAVISFQTDWSCLKLTLHIPKTGLDFPTAFIDLGDLQRFIQLPVRRIQAKEICKADWPSSGLPWLVYPASYPAGMSAGDTTTEIMLTEIS